MIPLWSKNAQVVQNDIYKQVEPKEKKIKLRNHIKEIHLQLKKEVCNYCDVSFESKVKLGLHIKKIHSIEKPFKCEYCEKSFANNSSLKTHVDRYNSFYRFFMLKPYISFPSRYYLKYKTYLKDIFITMLRKTIQSHNKLLG